MKFEFDHWSSPNGCHPDCPACAAEADPLTAEEAAEIVLALAEDNVLREDQCCCDGMARDRLRQIEAVAAVRSFLKAHGLLKGESP